MVELIPRPYILHLVGDTGKRPVTENESFIDFCKEEGIELVSTTETTELKDIIRQYRPEILLIEEKVFKENIGKDVEYRSRSCAPFILVLTEKGGTRSERFEFIKQGADDVVPRDIEEEEAFFKIFSILRRKSILENNQLTDLPSINRCYTVLEHCRKNLSDWAVVHLDIRYFQSYTVMYGVAQGDKAISEAADVLQDAMKATDLGVGESFLGHLGRDSFLIICNTNSLDLIIQAITSKFKSLQTELYREADIKNGYIISSAGNKVRRKEGLMGPSIGYCTNIDRAFLSGTDIVEQAIKNKKDQSMTNKRVLILEDDPDFALLLEDTLVREGNEARTSKGLDSLIDEVKDYEPKILIIEASSIGKEKFIPLCGSLQRYKEEHGMKILVATHIPGYQNFLASGADVYIPKPYDIEVLLKEVRRLRFNYA